MKRILALFTCFNRKLKTERCIESLMHNKACEIDFIVVDDNSTDGTKEMLMRHENVTLLNGNGKLFYSGGMREAISYARSTQNNHYDFVMFINDDVQFFDNAIDKLVEYAKGFNGIVTGAVCDSSGNLTYVGERRTSKFKPKYCKVRIEEKVLSCDTTCANCVLVPCDIFLKIPNIDSAYTHAMGDFDYFHEATRRGYSIISTDFYVGECDNNPVSGTWEDSSLTIKDRLRLKESIKGLPFKAWFHYLRKNYGLISALVFSFTPYIKILIKRQ